LLSILREHDQEAQRERSLEPEWLAADALFDLCHEGLASGRVVSDVLVGGVASHVNRRLEFRGEDFRLGARKIGVALKSLGLRTEKLGRLGRGLRLSAVLNRRIHEIAKQMGIDRRSIAPLAALENGYGGAPCSLCEELGLTGGLQFVNIAKTTQWRHGPSSRRRLLDVPDQDLPNRDTARQEVDGS